MKCHYVDISLPCPLSTVRLTGVSIWSHTSLVNVPHYPFRPSTSPAFGLLPKAHVVKKYSVWDSALPGVELGFLRLDPAVLTTWRQFCGNYSHSTVLLTSYPTHEGSSYFRFNPPPPPTPTPKLRYFNQYYSPLLPQFLPEAMNFIHNKR